MEPGLSYKLFIILVNLFFTEELVIWEPSEFRNKSFMAHLNEMPWAETLLTEQIEKRLYKGMHMTFCKKKDDTWGVVRIS